MSQVLLFLGFSLLLTGILILTEWHKHVPFKTLMGLFLFGVLISTPFIFVELLEDHLKYYIVILAFIAIEFTILFCEHRVKTFHDLLHHNVKDLRILSFFLIGIGFTYSEVAFTIFHTHIGALELLKSLPLKTTYAMLIHTVLTSAASLASFGSVLAETILETIFKVVSYYLRITVVCVSHYLYLISIKHHLTLLITVLSIICILAFFLIKKKLDHLHQRVELIVQDDEMIYPT